jgi:lauroyl/myristoyl acyltransferase
VRLLATDLYYLFVIALILLLRLAPYRRLREAFIDGAAGAAYLFSRAKRRRIERNLLEALGDLDAERRRRIVRGSLRGLWEDLFGAPERRAEVRGLERLEAALARGKGVILWESKGLGRRAASKQILQSRGLLVHQVHGANSFGAFLNPNSAATWLRRAVLKPFFDSCERPYVAEIIDLPGSNSLAFTRRLRGLLQENAILCISGDGRSGQKLIRLPFLGGAEHFSPGMVSLAKISGATILPMFCLRQPEGCTTLVIEEPIRLDTGVAQYADMLEAYISRYPEQYRNWHLLRRAEADAALS